MGSVREHIQHAGMDQTESLVVNQNARVPCQRGGITGYVNDSVRVFHGHKFDYFPGPAAWGVQQYFIKATVQKGRGRIKLIQVRAPEPGIADPVVCRIGPCPFNQFLRALGARDPLHGFGQWQGKISQTAK